MGFAGVIDFIVQQVEGGRLGDKLETESKAQVLRVLGKLMHYVEAHTFRSAFNLGIELVSEGKPHGGQLATKGLRLVVQGKQVKTSCPPWAAKAFSFHNELNLMDLLSDVGDLAELQKASFKEGI